MAYKPSKLTLGEAIELIKELGGAENSKAELARAGECGDITATGLIVLVMGGVPWPETSERIPPRFWRYTIYWDENVILQTPYERHERLDTSEKAREIRIKRSEIEAGPGDSRRKDDPQNAATNNSGQGGRTFSKQKVTDAYRKRVEDWPENERSPRRDDDLMWARPRCLER